MAVAWFKNPVLDDATPLIDRGTVDERTFGITRAKRHPAYVYSTNRNSALMHKVDHVKISHYAIVGMHQIGRLKQPAMVAVTACGYFFPLLAERSRTCQVPSPGSILCGRCHGTGSVFTKRQRAQTKDGVSRAEAHVRLACTVNGYPTSADIVTDSDRKVKP